MIKSSNEERTTSLSTIDRVRHEQSVVRALVLLKKVPRPAISPHQRNVASAAHHTFSIGFLATS